MSIETRGLFVKQFPLQLLPYVFSFAAGRQGGRSSADFPPPNRSKSDYSLASASDDSAPSSPAKRNTRATLVRTNSYQRGTQSSKAKTQDYSSSTLPSNYKKNSKGRSKVDPALKNKYKSTPDISNLDIDEDDDFVSLPKVPAKTAEDVLSKENAKAKKYSRRSMPATKLDRQDPFGLNQPHSDEPIGVRTRSSGAPTNNGIDHDRDRKAMPPPATTKVPAVKQDPFHKKLSSQSSSSLTLEEAKAILLGKSSSGSGKPDSGLDSSSSSTSGKLDSADNPPSFKAPTRVRSPSPVRPDPIPQDGPERKWSQSSKEDLDEMPVKERPRRMPFRQPMTLGEGEGDDPREGSPEEEEPSRRPMFPTSARSPSPGFTKPQLEVASPTRKQYQPPQQRKADLSGLGLKSDTANRTNFSRSSADRGRGSADEADSPGSSDTEPETMTPRALRSPPPPRHSGSVPARLSDRDRGPPARTADSSARSPGLRSPARPGSPIKTFTLPRDPRSSSATELPHSASDPRFSYGSLDRKGRLPEPRPKDSGATNDNSVDILGNFIKKGSSSTSSSERDSFSPPRRDPRDNVSPRRDSFEPKVNQRKDSASSAISEEEKPAQTVKSRISSWETAVQRSPSQSPSPLRRRAGSPTKGVAKPRTPEGTPPPPRPNNTPLPPPPASVASPPRLTSPEMSPPRAIHDKDSSYQHQSQSTSSSSRLVPKQKDNSGLVITPTRNRTEFRFEPDAPSVGPDTENEPIKTFHTKPKELPKIPETDAVIEASPAARAGLMNATFVVSPRGQDASNTSTTTAAVPLPGATSLRAASRHAAGAKPSLQQQYQATAAAAETVREEAEPAEGDDGDEIKRPDKSRRYPPTSLTASPPHQIKRYFWCH